MSGKVSSNTSDEENHQGHQIQPMESEGSLANGVAEMEAITQSWTRTGLYIAWATVIILNTVFALESQSISIYSNYATSSFSQHSILATLQVVEGVTNVCTRPILAKFIDIFGRTEGFFIAVWSTVIGLCMLASSPNIGVYFAGQVFLSIGRVTWNSMTNALAFDSSDLVHRTLMSTISGFCYLFTPWTLGPMTTRVLQHSTWRWGIAMWTIILPVVAIPLFWILFYSRNKAKKSGLKKSKLQWKKVLIQFDLGGSILLAAGLALVFLAIPLASSDAEQWRKTHIIVMIVIGGLSLIGFFIYEYFVPQYPILSYRIMKNKRISLSCLYIMLYYLGYFIYSPYFFAWLMVVFDLSNTAATNVSQISGVATTAAAIGAGVLIKFVRRLKWTMTAGCALMMIGFGLVFAFRHAGTSIGKLIVGHIIKGIGAGCMATPNMILVQSYCTHAEVAQTMALYNSFLSMGQIIGDAVSGSVYRKYYLKYLRQAFPDQSDTWIMSIYNDYTKALGYPVGTPERDGIVTAYDKVMRILLIPPLATYGTMFLIAFTAPDISLDKVNDGLKGIIFGTPKVEPREESEKAYQEAEERNVFATAKRFVRKLRSR